MVSVGLITTTRLSHKKDVGKGANTCSKKSPGDVSSTSIVPKLWSDCVLGRNHRSVMRLSGKMMILDDGGHKCGFIILGAWPTFSS